MYLASPYVFLEYEQHDFYKTGHRKFFYKYKNVFRLKFQNENIGVQPKKFMIFWSFYNSNTLFSQIFSGGVRTLFTESSHRKDSFRYKKNQKIIISCAKILRTKNKRIATKLTVFLIIFERSYLLLQNISWEWVHKFHWK